MITFVLKMVNIPNRLLEESFVDILYHDHRISVLQKTIQHPIDNRSSYVTKHAISFVLQGMQRISTDGGNTSVIREGQIGFFKKGIYTVTDLLSKNGVFSSFHLFFDDLLLQKVFQQHQIQSSNTSTSLFAISSGDYMKHYLHSIHQLRQNLSSLSYELMESKIMELFAILMADSTKTELKKLLGNWKNQDKKSIRNFMESHFDKEFSIEDYAYLTGRSPATFRREFKLKFGISPKKWIIQRRLEQAQRLLTSSNLSIGDVASQIGYDNTSHFIQAFKKAFGHTPNEYVLKERMTF